MNASSHLLKIATVVLLAAVGTAMAQVGVPTLMSYQGRISNEGTNLHGVGYFKFALVSGGVNLADPATAWAFVDGGEIFSISISNGGSGYDTDPGVTILDDTGSGASATAHVVGGSVTEITLISGGSGYSAFPSVLVDPPPAIWEVETYWSNDGTSFIGLEPTESVAVPIEHGLFNVLLGDTVQPGMTQPLEPYLFEWRDDAYIRVWFSEDDTTFHQLSPDQPMGSTVYAMMAGRVPYSSITEVQLANFAVTHHKIDHGAVRANHLLNGAITELKLADGSVTTDKIADGAVTSNKIDWATMPLPDVAAALRGYSENGMFPWPPTAVGINSIAMGNGTAAYGEGSVVGGGENNEAGGSHATVSGGSDNNAGSDGSTVAGGSENQAYGVYSTISGGQNNWVTDDYGVVAGGQDNVAMGDGATVGGGIFNRSEGQKAVVGGGWRNRASGNNSTIAGGSFNDASAASATVGGGSGNKATNTASTVAGGQDNTAGGFASSVVGGEVNVAMGEKSFVGGGENNTALGDYSVLAGGSDNYLEGDSATLAGGVGNVATPYASAIGGGAANQIKTGASYAVIPGGRQNQVGDNAMYAFAAGYNARANHAGSFVLADGTGAVLGSADINTFNARFANGYYLHGGPIYGDGSGLTNLPPCDCGGGEPGGSTECLWTESGSSLYRLTGRVGIGLTTPQHQLHVRNTEDAIGVLQSTSGRAKWHLSSASGNAAVEFQEGSTFRGSVGYNHTDNYLFLYEGGNVALKGGKLGVGTTDPAHRLHVFGDSVITGRLAVGKASIMAGKALDVSGTTRLNQGPAGLNALEVVGPSGFSGNVGIGVASPTRRLHVESDGSGTANTTAFINNTHAAGISLVVRQQSTDVTTILDQRGSGDFLYADAWDGDSNWQRVIKLEKSGTIECKTLRITGGSDFAEGFDVADPSPVQPGAVMSIDPDHPGKLRVADEPYDRRVAGIVSGAGGVNPGVRMGQQDSIADGEIPISLSGRAYCLADASNGPIQPGDLLTSSATPGHAMRADDASRSQGAVIGKAMTPLNEGQGLVLVLISLH